MSSAILQNFKHLISQNINFSDVLLKTGEAFKYRLPDGYQKLNDHLLESPEIEEFARLFMG